MYLQDDAGAKLEVGGPQRQLFLESQGKVTEMCSGMHRVVRRHFRGSIHRIWGGLGLAGIKGKIRRNPISIPRAGRGPHRPRGKRAGSTGGEFGSQAALVLTTDSSNRVFAPFHVVAFFSS